MVLLHDEAHAVLECAHVDPRTRVGARSRRRGGARDPRRGRRRGRHHPRGAERVRRRRQLRRVGTDEHCREVLRLEVRVRDALDVLARDRGELPEVARLVVRVAEDALRVAEKARLPLHRLLAVDELALEVAARARQLGAAHRFRADTHQGREQLARRRRDFLPLE